MADILVAYFSRSGTTETLARELARRLGADLDRIRTRTDYSGAAGFRRGIWHSILRRAPDVEFEADPADHALVVLAGPIWAGSMAAPLRAYVKANQGRIVGAAALCVSGSGGAYPKAFGELAALLRRPLLATAALAERDVGSGKADAKLAAFAQALRGQVRRAA
jgi:hypothetical protein